MNYFRLFLFSMAALVATACTKSDEGTGGKEPVVDNGTYVGTVTVDQNDGTVYTQENVTMTFEQKSGTAQIKMSQVGFSQQMPVKLDMTIPGITATETTDGLTISGDNIVPQAMGGDFPKYTIKNMTGKVTADAISFDMVCGGFPFSFKGRLSNKP